MLKELLIQRANRIIFLTGILLFNVLSLCGRVYLGAPFMTGMVLQQKSDVSLWGKATANAKVTILPSWMTTSVSCNADQNGNWKIKVTTPAASFEKQTITFSDGSDKNTVVGNVLIGEVWIASGQSNMSMPVVGWTNSPIHNVDSILNSAENYADKLRFTTIPIGGSRYPQDSTKVIWQRCSKSAVENFSAVAYFFATHLIDSLNVPVGIISCSYGGSSLETWIPTEVNESFGDIVMDNSTYNNINQQTPSACYNAMMFPLRGYTASGFIWYQGENNAYGDYESYCFRLCKMIESWRAAWGQNNMKFYIVELTPYSYGNVDGTNAAFTREQQNITQHVLDDVRLIGTNDLILPSETEQIHPSHKLQVGQRLGDCALHDLYGFTQIHSDSPEMKNVSFKDGKAYISFTHIERGFNIDNGIIGFELAGNDGIFYAATGSVENGQVVVSSSSVTNPVSVRYCFRNFLMGNLKNKEGWPVLPFRSDNSPIRFVTESTDGNAGQQALSKVLGYNLMTIDRYAGGTDPGFTEQSYYDQYEKLLTDAQNTLQAGNNQEELSNMKEQLVKCSSEVDSKTIPLTEGYYQIVSGYSGFKTKQGVEKAMYGGISGSLGWNTLSNNTNYIFKLSKSDTNAWMIKCIGTQSYIVPVSKNDEKLVLNEVPSPKFIFERFHKGQWGIVSTDFDEELNAFGSKDGAGTNGNIQALSGKFNTPSSWYLRKITDETKIENLEISEIKIQLQKKLLKYKAFNDSTFVGSSFGDVDQAEKDLFTNCISECEDYQNATKEELQIKLTKLEKCYIAFREARKTFSTNVWYYIVNMDETMGSGETATDKSYHGNAMYLKSNNTQDCYRWLASRDIAGWNFFDYKADSLLCLHNPYAMWRVCRIEGNDSCYAIQNRGTGTYLSGTLVNTYHGSSAKPQPFGIYLLGHNQFRIVSFDDENVDRLPLSAVATNNGILNVSGGFNEPSAWNLVPVDSDDKLGYVEMEGLSNSISIMCLPFAINQITCKNNSVKTYALKDIKNENTLELTEQQSFQPGEPFFLLLGDLNSQLKETTTFQILPPNEFNYQAETANGLVGVLDKAGINQKGMIYFGNTDNVIKESGNLTVSIEGHKGYINPSLVTEKLGNVDLAVSITSTDGILRVVSDDKVVDVYSIDGQLLMQSVRLENVSKILKKGIYIINKKKIVID